MVVTGAEKLPLDLLRDFEAKFGIQVSEGYGMTEASPVVAVNLFDEPPSQMNPDGVLGRRIGSVGRMVPGLTARIRDPETDEELDLFQSGMLWLRGANVFEGYFKDTDQTTAVLQEGWYKTGDVGRLRRGRLSFHRGPDEPLLQDRGRDGAAPDGGAEDRRGARTCIRRTGKAPLSPWSACRMRSGARASCC